MFAASCVPVETTQILSGAFPDAIVNRGIIRGEIVKSCTPYLDFDQRNRSHLYSLLCSIIQ
jgi:hypothetical protein